MHAVCSKAVFHLPYHLGTPGAKRQTFRGIQTTKSAAVWGSSELRGHFFPNEINQTWASGPSRKVLTRWLLVTCTHFRSMDPALAGGASGEMLRGTGWVCAHFWRTYGYLANQMLLQGCFSAASLLGLLTPILLAPAWYVWAVLDTRSGWCCSCLPSAFPPGSGPLPIAEGWPGAAPSGEPLLCFYLPLLGSKLQLASSHGPLALPSAQLTCSASAYISSSSWPYFSSTAGCCPLLW